MYIYIYTYPPDIGSIGSCQNLDFYISDDLIKWVLPCPCFYRKDATYINLDPYSVIPYAHINIYIYMVTGTPVIYLYVLTNIIHIKLFRYCAYTRSIPNINFAHSSNISKVSNICIV